MPNIEENVVSMKFDGANFEKNAQKAIKTVELLKSTIDGLRDYQAMKNFKLSTENMDVSPIANALDNIQSKFSLTGVMAMEMMHRISNAAINAGKSIVDGLVLDPIKTGLTEYETKIGAIQVLQTNTGDDLRDINAALDELNTYADKTIYNFAQMTSNAGKFAAQGMSSKQAADAIKGLANLAAASGASAENMSRATYQMSQAMGGVIKLLDWNSLRNANMGTTQLKDAIKDVAKNWGIDVDSMIKKYGTFEQTLQENWLTGDLFKETMNMYSGVYSEAELMAKGYTKEQIENFQDLAKKAEEAATAVKTFTQFWDVLKETAQSGWTRSWEIIFGNLDEAKKMWTSANNAISDMLDNSADARNRMFQAWKDAGGRDSVINSFKNIFNGYTQISNVLNNAFKSAFNNVGAAKLVEISRNLEKLTSKFALSDETAALLGRTFRGLFSIIDIGINLFTSFGKSLSTFADPAKKVLNYIFGITAGIGDFIYSVDQSIKRNASFKKFFDSLFDSIKNVATSIDIILGSVVGMFKNIASDSLFNDILNKLKEFPIIGDIIQNGFVDTIVKGFDILSSGALRLSDVISTVFSTFSEFAKFIATGAKTLFGVIMVAFQNLFGILKDMDINSLLNQMNFASLSIFVANLGNNIGNLSNLLSSVKDIVKNVSMAFDNLGEYLEKLVKGTDIGSLMLIGRSLLYIAGALFVIAALPFDKLVQGFGGLFGIMLMFTGVMTGLLAITKVFTKDSPELIASFRSITTSMMKMSFSFLMLALALDLMLPPLIVFASLDWTKAIGGIALLVGTLVILGAGLWALSTYAPGAILAATSITLLAVAINLLTVPLIALSMIPFDKLLPACATLVATLAIMGGALWLIGENCIGAIIASAAFGILTFSILGLVTAFERLSKINWEDLGKGLIYIAAGAAVGVLVLTALSFVADKSSVALTILGFAFLKFTIGIERLSKAFERIAGSLPAFADSLANLTRNTKILDLLVTVGILNSALNKLGNTAMKIGNNNGLHLAAKGMMILSEGINKFSEINFSSIIKSIVAFNLTLGAIGRTTPVLMTTAIAIKIITEALETIPGVISNFSNIDFGTMVKGLISIKIALTALTHSASAFGNIGSVFNAVAVYQLAKAVATLTPCLSELANLSFGDTIKSWFALKTLIPVLVGGLKSLGKGSIFMALAGVGIYIFNAAIAACIPLLVSAMETFEKVIPTLKKFNEIPFLEIAGGLMAMSLAFAVFDIVGVVALLASFGFGLLSVSIEALAASIDVGLKSVPQFCDYIAKFAESLPYLAAMSIVFTAISPGILGFAISLGVLSVSIFAVMGALNMIPSFINNLSASLLALSSTIVMMAKTAHDGLSILATAGTDAINGFINGIRSNLSNITALGKEIATTFLNAFRAVAGWHSPWDTLLQAGKDAVTGLKDGIMSKVGDAKESGKKMGLMTILGIDDVDFFGDGVANGKDWLAGFNSTGAGNAPTRAGQLKYDDSGHVIDKSVSFQEKDANGNTQTYYKWESEVNGVNDANKDLDKTLKDVEDQVKDVGDAAGTAGGKGSKAAKDTKDSFAKLKDTLKNDIHLFDEFSGKTEKTSDQLLKNMRSQMEGMKTWSANIAKLAMRGMDQGLLKMLGDKGVSSFEDVNAFVNMTDEQLKEANELYQQSLLMPDAAAQYVSDSYALAGNMATEGFKKGLDDKELKNEGVEAADSVKEGMTSAEGLDINSPSRITYQYGTFTAMGLENGISDGIPRIKDKITFMCDEIIKTMDKSLSKDKMVDYGKYIIEGLKSGLEDKSKIAGLKTATTKLGDLVNKAFTKKEQIKSPSRVFMEFGKYIVEGLGIGIDKFASTAVNSATNLGSDVISTMNDAINRISTLTIGNMDMNPTIKPVVDLSNVRDSASQISSIYESNKIALDQARSISSSFISRRDIANARQAEQLNSMQRMFDSLNMGMQVAARQQSQRPVNVNVALEGEAKGVFNMVRNENTKWVKSAGWSPISRGI